MRLLFLHPNFPAQFKHVCKAFASKGHDVRFLCQTHYGRTVNGVQRICLKNELSHDALESKNLEAFQRTNYLANQFRTSFETLERNRWVPDLVISHSGWGCGLYIKEIWPKTKLISYLEWWFDPTSSLFNYDKTNPWLPMTDKDTKTLWERNQSISLELAVADKIIAPTLWQRNQLPNALRKNCEVIFDGIDQELFKPSIDNKSEYPLLTYGTRGMEAIRGFPEFIKELPNLLRQVPDLQVEIAGLDKIHYGGVPPSEGSWGSWAKQYIKKHALEKRIRWMGRLETPRYVNWLQSSWCHVYLTQPYVVSWSLAEAISCNCSIIGSDVEPVREFEGCRSITFTDHRKPGFLEPAEKVVAMQRDNVLRLQDREYVQKLGINTCNTAWMRVADVESNTTT